MEKTFDWKRPEILTIIITFAVGILVHIFGLVNVLHNYDSILVQPIGYGISIHSGRWALLLLGHAVQLLFGGYSLSWVNGVLFLFFVALTAGVIVSIFDIQSRSSAAFIGILFVSFPAATSTLLFRYTAHYDAFALFLAVLAVWFLEKYKYGLFPSVLLIAFSLGIYQAYIPLTISIYVLLLIRKVLMEDIKIGSLVLRGIYYCTSLVLGLAVYLVIMKFFLNWFDAELLPYQGINDMGNISLAQLPALVWNAFLYGCIFPLTDYASIAQTDALKIAYLLLWFIIIITLVYIAVVKKKNPLQILSLVLLCLIFPVAVNFIAVMCPNGFIYTLMIYSFALIPCIPLILQEIFPKATGVLAKCQHVLGYISVGIATLIIICNSYGANVNYTTSYFATCQTENFANSLVTQVRLTENFTPDKKWGIIGTLNDPLFYGTWDNVETYGGIYHSAELVRSYTFSSWIKAYAGYIPTWASTEELQELAENPVVSSMPTWPSAGSIQVIDDFVVIKGS